MGREKPEGLLKRFVPVVVFAIGLAFIESVVVVYLRALFYPEGFSFPIEELFGEGDRLRLLKIEIFREAATLVVLCSSAWVIGENGRTRWAYFLTIFATWDIFYYVWLKVLLDWPGSILDWDVLFLIPVTWASPVLSPVVISATMLLGAILILHRESSGRSMGLSRAGKIGLCVIGLILVAQFCYAGTTIAEANYKDYYHWSIFMVCEGAALFLIFQSYVRAKNR